jgi:hypothetical protein
MQLFDELCIQFPGRFTRRQYKSFLRRVNAWRRDARDRGVVIAPKTIRRLSDKPQGRRHLVFADHWDEMVQCLEEQPDQTAMELLIEFQARYPGTGNTLGKAGLPLTTPVRPRALCGASIDFKIALRKPAQSGGVAACRIGITIDYMSPFPCEP